jgi:hypothetical protein
VALRITKPWTSLSPEAIDRLPAQLGVFQIADADENVLVIGYAGGLEPFGLQTALRRELERPEAALFRLEYTSGYLTRWEELLMVHQADHGRLPAGNADHPHKLGRLAGEQS